MLRHIPRLGLYPKQVIVFQTVISNVRGESKRVYFSKLESWDFNPGRTSIELYSGTPTSILRTLSKLDRVTVRFTSNSQRNLFYTVLRDIQKSYWSPAGERIRTYVEPSFLDGSVSPIRLDYMLVNGREMNKSYTFYVEN